MTQNDVDTAELSQLFGCFLNQDYVDEYGTAADAIEAYRGEFTPESVAAAGRGADRLARSLLGEDELRRTLLDLGLEYTPWTDGWTAQTWLEWLAFNLAPPPEQL